MMRSLSVGRLVHPREAIGPVRGGWLRSRDARGRVRAVRRASTTRCASWPTTLAHELGLQAVPARCTLAGFPEPRPDRVYVLLDPRSYVAAEGPGPLPDDAILARTILLCVEPPPTDASDPHLELLRRAASVFAIDQRAVVALRRLGIRARLLRPGYTRLHDHFDPDRRPPDRRHCSSGRTRLRRTRYLDRRRARPRAPELRGADRAARAGRGETSSFLAETPVAAARADQGRHQPPLRRADPPRVAPACSMPSMPAPSW